HFSTPCPGQEEHFSRGYGRRIFRNFCISFLTSSFSSRLLPFRSPLSCFSDICYQINIDFVLFSSVFCIIRRFDVKSSLLCLNHFHTSPNLSLLPLSPSLSPISPSLSPLAFPLSPSLLLSLPLPLYLPLSPSRFLSIPLLPPLSLSLSLSLPLSLFLSHPSLPA